MGILIHTMKIQGTITLYFSSGFTGLPSTNLELLNSGGAGD